MSGQAASVCDQLAAYTRPENVQNGTSEESRERIDAVKGAIGDVSYHSRRGFSTTSAQTESRKTVISSESKI